MKLFEDTPEQLPEEQSTETKVDAAEEPGKLVLAIEGEELPPVEELPPITLKTETDRIPVTQTEEPAVEEEAPAGEESPVSEAPAEEAAPAAVTYASMAEAVETARKEPTGRFARDAVDDETLLAELYALIGRPEQGTPAKSQPAPVQTPAAGEEAAPVTPQPVPRPVTRLTPDALQAAPEEYEDLQEDDSTGVPGWLKGAFLLLISLLVSAMTFYAVASDVLGQIF